MRGEAHQLGSACTLPVKWGSGVERGAGSADCLIAYFAQLELLFASLHLSPRSLLLPLSPHPSSLISLLSSSSPIHPPPLSPHIPFLQTPLPPPPTLPPTHLSSSSPIHPPPFSSLLSPFSPPYIPFSSLLSPFSPSTSHPPFSSLSLLSLPLSPLPSTSHPFLPLILFLSPSTSHPPFSSLSPLSLPSTSHPLPSPHPSPYTPSPPFLRR